MAIIRNVKELRDYFGINPVLIDDLPVDVLRSETPVYDFDLTERPVESGFDITDARNAKPIGVTLEIILTDTELSASAIGFAALNQTLGFDTWKDKRDRLYEIKNSDELYNVVTPLDVYTFQTITSLRVDQVPETARALFCRIDFRQVRIVSTQTAPVDPRDLPESKEANKKLAKKKDKGTQQTKTATAKQSSILAKWLL